jgi:hypothetical protein
LCSSATTRQKKTATTRMARRSMTRGRLSWLCGDLFTMAQLADNQFSAHNASVETSLTKMRLPEMTGCAHVAELATVYRFSS